MLEAILLSPQIPRKTFNCQSDFSAFRRRLTLLLDEIVGQGESRAKILPAIRCAVLGKVGDRAARWIGKQSLAVFRSTHI